MGSPSVNLTIQDPGTGVTQSAPTTPLMMGCCSAGAVNTVLSFNSIPLAKAGLGEGPLAEVVALLLQQGGGPVKCIPLNATTAGAAGAVTATPTSTATGTITVAGAANDAYQVTVEIITTGTLGVADFRYRLDKASTTLTDGTWSAPLTVPSGGTYVLPNTGLTLTFVPGAGAVFFEDGDVHVFSCTEPLYSTTDLASGFAAMGSEQVAFIGLVGRHTSSANAATMFTALGSQLTSLVNTYQYAGALMEGGADTAPAGKAAFATVANSRVAAGIGDVEVQTAKPFVGWGRPVKSCAYKMLAKAHSVSISDDLARYAFGPEPGVTDITYDEFLNGTLANTKLSAMRTFPGDPGYYIDNVFMKSAPGSDFVYWQHRRVMDVACFTTYRALLRFLSSSLRTNSDGTIDERDAVRIEEWVKEALKVELIDPRNADVPQHVSALNATVDRSTNLQSSSKVYVTVAIRPLGYAKTIETTIGYAVNVGGE